MDALIMLRIEADRAGAPALALLLEVIAADLHGRGYVNPTERRLLLRGFARHQGEGSAMLARLYRRAVAVVEAIAEPVGEMRKAA